MRKRDIYLPLSHILAVVTVFHVHHAFGSGNVCFKCEVHHVSLVCDVKTRLSCKRICISVCYKAEFDLILSFNIQNLCLYIIFSTVKI